MNLWVLESFGLRPRGEDAPDEWRAIGLFRSAIAARHAAQNLQQEKGWSSVIDWHGSGIWSDPILGHRQGSRFPDWRIGQFYLSVREDDAS